MSFNVSVKFRGRDYRSPRQGFEAYRSFVEAAPDTAVKHLKPDMLAYLEDVVEALIAKHSKPYPGGTTNNTLSRRSGKSMEELRKGIKVTGNRLDTMRLTLSIPTPLAYHETGYTKGGKLMTIPLPAALNKNGTPKKASARMWKNTFIQTSRAGNLIIFQRIGRRIIPLYVLKDSITVQARLGAREMMQQQLPHFATRIADGFVAALS